MNWQVLFSQLNAIGQTSWASYLAAQCDDWLIGHGDYPRWQTALKSLPRIAEPRGIYSNYAVTIEGHCDDVEVLRTALLGLAPWRKGPFQIADVFIDSEWRSDLKWNRVLPHLSTLENRRVLDVGCGNGYYALRMLEQNPSLIIGIEPSVLFNLQFQALNKYLQREDLFILPQGIQDLPPDLCCFDTVFSMGVLYHRRSPIDHLYHLRDLLIPGGELCLETLVIEGDEGEVLVPEGRYARMRNVWFLPSVMELMRWLRRCGFVDIRVVDQCQTGIDEQRSTDWMQFESLDQSLDPENQRLTIEGLPAPRRAVVLANKP